MVSTAATVSWYETKVLTQVSAADENHETVVVTVTTVENTISLAGTVSTTVAVIAIEVDAVELQTHSVTATVTVCGTEVSAQTGEHELTGACHVGGDDYHDGTDDYHDDTGETGVMLT